MKHRYKNAFLSKENYILLLVSVKSELEERFAQTTDCVFEKTNVHICLTRDYCEFLGNKLIEFLKPIDEFKCSLENVFDDLVCEKFSEYISYYNCREIYDSVDFPTVILDEKKYLSADTYPNYAFFMRICTMLEDGYLHVYEEKKEIINYLIYFFRQEGIICRRERNAIRKLQRDINEINKELTKEETLCEIRNIIQKASYTIMDGKKKKSYYNFLNFMRKTLTWYIEDKDVRRKTELLDLILSD